MATKLSRVNMTTNQKHKGENKMDAILKDEDNPVYALQVISTKILLDAAYGSLDLNELAKAELISRGYDDNWKK